MNQQRIDAMGVVARLLHALGSADNPELAGAFVDLARIASTSINVMNLRGMTVDELCRHIEGEKHEEKYAAGRD